MIKVLFKDSSEIETISYAELEKRLSIRYLRSLKFQKEPFLKKTLKESKKALKRKDLSMRENWLGVRFKKELTENFEPNVSIRWIDDILGYGIFAEEDIPAGAFLGEYTGIIRKRRRRHDRKNDYCFEYTIGDWVYNPFIIDAQEQGNFTRFINHSQEPNVESLSVHANNIMHIIFVAAEPIKSGKQLRYHYGDTFWKKRRHALLVDL